MQAHSPPDQIDVQEPPSQPRPSAAQVREEQRRLKEENERARQRFQATKVSINETWERLVRNLGGAAPDRDLRHAALNLLEDTELARLGEEAQAASRERAEARTRASEAQLRALAENLPGGAAFIIDRERRYQLATGEAIITAGLKPEDFLGRTVEEAVGHGMAAAYEPYLRQAFAGEAFSCEHESHGRNFLPRGVPLRNGSGEVESVLAVSYDITERKSAEEVRRQNEALFSTIIEQAPGGVYVVDDEFRVSQVNSESRGVFASAEPVIGRDFNEVMRIVWGPELGPELAAIFRHTLETGERYVSPPFTAPRNDLGIEQSYEWETQRLTLPNGKCGVVCYFTDSTEARAMERRLREAKDAAEQANASKDRFLAVLSHELRTPLTPVLMVVAALEHDPELRPDVREDLTMMKRNIELETKLIDDLLDLSRITNGKLRLALETVDLNEAVRQVCGVCRPQMKERGLRLETDFDPAAGCVSADPARLQQVLWNVLKNAIKFTPENGTIRVTTRHLGGRCEVRVQDSGMGIAPEVLPLIFDAFEQGHAHVTRQFGGLGLGLAICRALVDLHGGAIRAESEGPGQGATFIIELPVAIGPAAAKSPGGAPAATGGSRPLRLLVVEDHADTARILTRHLSRAGFAVTTAGDVASATATAEREPFDLLISDLGLPDGSGCEIMRHIRAHRPVPGIAMSGFGMEEDIQRSREAGFAEHLVKPIEVPQLLAAIRRVAGNRERLARSPTSGGRLFGNREWRGV